MPLISVIVTTYNWPEALGLCLDSLLNQPDRNFEILIADDGSEQATADKIKHYQNRDIAIRHVFHADRGFRAGTIRNKAVAQSHGDYLIFTDGDCLLFPDFIEKHRQLAEKGYFVPGNRVLLNQAFTRHVLTRPVPLYQASLLFFGTLRLQKKINRISPLLRLPLGNLRKLQARKWQQAMTCNLGVWKADFLQVNGFDEQFEGWGYEDSDLVIRLIHQGVYRKEGRFALPVLHLWHPAHDKTHQQRNYQRLMQRLKQTRLTRAEKGVSQYL